MHFRFWLGEGGRGVGGEGGRGKLSFLRKLNKGVNSNKSISVCIESEFDFKQWLSDKDYCYNKFLMKSLWTHLVRTTKKIILKKMIVILLSIRQNKTKKFQMK